MLQLALTASIYLLIVIPAVCDLYCTSRRGKHTFADPVFDRVDGAIYKISGVDPGKGMNWKQYALALLGTNAVMVFIGYLILRVQSAGLFNPNNIENMEPTLAFNTIISFMTNTNLQHYSGESGLSYLSQMLVIIFMMFVSAASGYAACVAFIRGLAGRTKNDVGNFFADLVRITTRILLPFSIVGGLLLVWQGVPQNFEGNVVVETLEGTFQVIAMGPIAALEIIKHLGTNGGGFLGANSSTPLENPTMLSNLIELYSMMLLPGACVITFGKMVHARRQEAADGMQRAGGLRARGGLSAAIYGREGRSIFAAMGILFVIGLSVCFWAESQGNPALADIGLDQAMGSMEGKEVRFGIAQSAMFTTVTTSFTTGTVNNMHDTLTPARRHDPSAAHDAERSIRRQGRRSDEYDPVRHSGSVHLRPDDRAHAGIPGQKDRRPGNEAHRAVHHHPPAAHPCVFRAGSGHRSRAGGHHQSGLSRPEPGAV